MTALPQLPRRYALLRAHRWAKGPLPPSSSTVGRELARRGLTPFRRHAMHGSSDTVYYTTPIAVIGSHEWVLQVYQQAVHGSRCTRYGWRRCGELRWRPGREWPTYDINDGMYAGLPKRLGRHYGRHQAAIEKALGRVPPQAELFNAPNPFLSQQREDF